MQRDQIVCVPLEEAVADLNYVADDLWETAKQLFA